MFSVTFGVVGPVAIVRLAAALSVVFVAVSTKSSTVFAAVALLVRFTTTLKLVTAAVNPSIPVRLALPTSALNAV
jgi:hypothetical protein